MPARRRLPAPRTKYIVDQPMIQIPLGEYERLVNHTISLMVLKDQPENVQVGLRNRHKLILAEETTRLRNARRFYGITEVLDQTHVPKK